MEWTPPWSSRAAEDIFGYWLRSLYSRPIVVTTAAVAGHFSFGPQYSAMRDLLCSNPEIFA